MMETCTCIIISTCHSTSWSHNSAVEFLMFHLLFILSPDETRTDVYLLARVSASWRVGKWQFSVFRGKGGGKGKTKWKVPPKHDLLNGACNLGLACCLANYTFQAAATVNSRVILFVYLCKNSAPLSLGQRQSHNAHFCVCAGGGVGSFVIVREVRCIPIVQSHGHEVQTAAVLPLNTEKQHSLDWAISSTEGGGVIMSDWNSSPTTSFTTPAGRVAFQVCVGVQRKLIFPASFAEKNGK